MLLQNIKLSWNNRTALEKFGNFSCRSLFSPKNEEVQELFLEKRIYLLAKLGPAQVGDPLKYKIQSFVNTQGTLFGTHFQLLAFTHC